MAEVITMPRLSDTMSEGKVAKWHKKVGDSVKEGDILAEIETDKAVQDFESEFDGILLYVGVEENAAAPVDSILAIIGKEGEDISYLKGGKSEEENLDKTETKTEEEEVKSEVSNIKEISGEIPEGVEVINMPRLSDTMTEGKVAKWHKNVGDKVKEGDIIAEIETDKAVQDFESEFDGTLLYRSVEENEGAPVDTILAIIGPEGTDVSGIISGGSSPKKSEDKPKESKTENVVSTTKGDSPVKTETQEVSTNQNSTDRVAISPLAKKIAEDKGIDLHSLKGSGDNGRIVKKDIENYQPSAKVETSNG
jgi:pyruvate dehydrogenase E2 component (dihydrolipoamide acetyltransferase)